ncbi:YggS family pyridoxal phosphate-dependent enzyme [Sphingobium bisphenolivorans]|uniref:YggS family pyridoxal phosphate-dependent enzyme n=1 Tax=Sphingobium bisphenolivorans TaxID=1335760 RepID=UPI0003A5DB2F|nr:YggS family pyridoxal phosphate-dependent enzyme [Sphingobium bisphenolivorans]
MTTDTIEAANRLGAVRDAMGRSARLTERTADDINLIAVSKTKAADAIRPLIEAGQRGFGENRVQETQEKWPALREEFPDLTLHLVGQLQSNKAAEAVALFDVIHSLDRPSLLPALAKAMDAADRRVPCFLQVNIGAEAQKGGCPIAEVPSLIRAARDADIPLLGLMCVPPAEVEPAPFFALMAKVAREEGLDRLSMGMSGDFETAIMLGATDIRVGTALFGERPAAARPTPASGRGMIRNSRAG